MGAESLTPAEQAREIRSEFFEEAAAYSRNRSDIERTMALNHINALLDAYNTIKLDLVEVADYGE